MDHGNGRAGRVDQLAYRINLQPPPEKPSSTRLDRRLHHRTHYAPKPPPQGVFIRIWNREYDELSLINGKRFIAIIRSVI